MTSAIPSDLARRMEGRIKAAYPHALDAHPDIRLVRPEELLLAGWEADRIQAFYRQRHETIARQWECPLLYGYRPPCWRKVDAILAEMRAKWPAGVLCMLLSGGNRSGKSEYAGNKVMQTLTGTPQARAWCFQATEAMSWSEQQPIIYKNFPPDWRPGESGRLKKGMTTNISYNDKTGFGGNSFTLPNKARCDFKFYASESGTFEGAKLHIVWADELIPQEFIEPLEFRLAQMNGLFLMTFTPVKGYSPAYATFTEGATAVEEIDLEIPIMGEDGNFARWEKVPKRGMDGQIAGVEKVPVVLACRQPARSVVYFDTRQNFYGSPENVIATVMRRPKDQLIPEAKLRLYGIPKSAASAKFPWDDEHHMVSVETVAQLLSDRSRFTLVHVMDPAHGRNFCMQWWADLPNGQMVCVDEWPMEGDYIPGVGDPGPWAVSGALGGDPTSRRRRELADGARGPAQEPFRLTLRQVSAEIRRKEMELGKFSGGGRLEPLERNVDSRAGASGTTRADAYTTLLQEFLQIDGGDGLLFSPAPGGGKNEAGEDWITLIQELMSIDPVLKAPKLLVSARCTNTIWALRHWTGLDGPTGACKDFIDLTKYKVLRPVKYVDMEAVRRAAQQGGSY